MKINVQISGHGPVPGAAMAQYTVGAFYRLSGRINPPRANVLTRPHFASLHKLKLLFEARLLLFAPSDEAISR
jgi:hypothetical protein